MHVMYRGTSDERILSAADLKTLGVESGFSKTTFRPGHAVEVDDAVGEALTTHRFTAPDFQKVDLDDPEEVERLQAEQDKQPLTGAVETQQAEGTGPVASTGTTARARTRTGTGRSSTPGD